MLGPLNIVLTRIKFLLNPAQYSYQLSAIDASHRAGSLAALAALAPKPGVILTRFLGVFVQRWLAHLEGTLLRPVLLIDEAQDWVDYLDAAEHLRIRPRRPAGPCCKRI